MEHIAKTTETVKAITQSGSTSQQKNLQKVTGKTSGYSNDGGITLAELLNESVLRHDDAETKREMLARLTASYKLDYFDSESIHCAGARDLFRRAVEKGWTSHEFLARLDVMTEECAFPTWTPADFFKNENRAKLYPYSWALSQRDKNHRAMEQMEAYKVPGYERPLWRYADGSNLPFELVFRCGKHYGEQAKPAVKPLEPAPELGKMVMELNGKLLAVTNELEQSKKRNAALMAKIERLEAEIERMNAPESVENTENQEIAV